MKYIFLFVLCSVALSQNSPCPHKDVREMSIVEALIKGISQQSNEETRVLYIKNHIGASNKGLTFEHVKMIIPKFSFIVGRVSAIKIMDPFILGLKCSEVVEILKLFTFSEEKLEALKTIAPTILDIETQKVIIDHFAFSGDKEKAREILKDIKNRNCIFGTIKERVAVFLIDTSGSMEARFSHNGKQYTRLSLVQEELSKTITEQLKPYQRFNIIGFSDSSRPWQSEAVNATTENIKSSVSFIQGLRIGGGTNMWNGIARSLGQNSLEAVFLLTDGMPTDLKPDEIVKRIVQFNTGREKKVIFHATAFLMGNHTSDDKPSSRKFMNEVAGSTGGTYRNLDL